MLLYNYLGRKKEIFKPLKKGFVGLYTCGPTVYDRVHIGNFRTYIFEDLLKKTLEEEGFKVKHVMNITDIDDKIIKKMLSEDKTLGKITRPFTKAFLEDAQKLNIKKADLLPKATGHIKEMAKLIEKLLKKGYAYKSQDGSIYYNVSKFKEYGVLSRIPQSDLKHGSRVEADEYNKLNAGDFALWKTAKPREPKWKTSFGEGRPGWHIECSAMSGKYLGETFDIHAGAVDLIFPHHENEIAQSEAASGKKFVNYWVEGEHLLANGEKMSKSLGNFFTLEDILKKGFDPLAFRYLVLSAHYRSKLNFTWEALAAAEEGLKNLRYLSFEKYLFPAKEKTDTKKERKYEKKFREALDNDLNAPQALKTLWEALRDNSLPLKSKTKLVKIFDKVLGLGLKTNYKIPAEVLKISRERERARNKKEWQTADLLREKAKNLGWVIEDSSKGAILRKK
ncbi:MAG: cysteine--tRNA ligase [Candidatus Pacebacteria bacterium]|nr:cysteine--tRNA ligase [Candidatus Paceibacterota bacterium]